MKLSKMLYCALIVLTSGFTLHTLNMFLQFRVGRLHFTDASGEKSNTYAGSYKICKFDDYGPIMATINYKTGINEIMTCPWSDPVLIWGFLSLASILTFIGCLCAKPCIKKEKSLQRNERVTLISGLLGTGLLIVTCISMLKSIPGSVNPPEYENNEVKVTYSKTIYWYSSKWVFENIILVGFLYFWTAMSLLRKGKGEYLPSSALPDIAEHKRSAVANRSIDDDKFSIS